MNTETILDRPRLAQREEKPWTFRHGRQGHHQHAWFAAQKRKQRWRLHLLSKRTRPLSCAGKEVRAIVWENPLRLHAIRDTSRIYFMRSGSFVKIGKSFHPESRIKVLRQQTGYDIDLIGHFEGYAPDEGRLHALFERSRYVGEWFRLTPAIARTAEVMCGLKAGAVDNIIRTSRHRSSPAGSFGDWP